MECGRGISFYKKCVREPQKNGKETAVRQNGKEKRSKKSHHQKIFF